MVSVGALAKTVVEPKIRDMGTVPIGTLLPEVEQYLAHDSNLFTDIRNLPNTAIQYTRTLGSSVAKEAQGAVNSVGDLVGRNFTIVPGWLESETALQTGVVEGVDYTQAPVAEEFTVCHLGMLDYVQTAVERMRDTVDVRLAQERNDAFVGNGLKLLSAWGKPFSYTARNAGASLLAFPQMVLQASELVTGQTKARASTALTKHVINPWHRLFDAIDTPINAVMEQANDYAESHVEHVTVYDNLNRAAKELKITTATVGKLDEDTKAHFDKLVNANNVLRRLGQDDDVYELNISQIAQAKRRDRVDTLTAMINSPAAEKAIGLVVPQAEVALIEKAA